MNSHGTRVHVHWVISLCAATKISGWMGYQTRLKGAPTFWGYMCGKWGIATFWGKSVVRGKIVSSPFGVLVVSPPATCLTTTFTRTHTRQRAYLLRSRQRNDRTDDGIRQ